MSKLLSIIGALAVVAAAALAVLNFFYKIDFTLCVEKKKGLCDGEDDCNCDDECCCEDDECCCEADEEAAEADKAEEIVEAVEEVAEAIEEAVEEVTE